MHLPLGMKLTLKRCNGPRNGVASAQTSRTFCYKVVIFLQYSHSETFSTDSLRNSHVADETWILKWPVKSNHKLEENYV
jgi:hypothetical protein